MMMMMMKIVVYDEMENAPSSKDLMLAFSGLFIRVVFEKCLFHQTR